MKTTLWLCLVAVPFTSGLCAQDVTGDWLGTLKTGGPELRLALHIKKAADGSLSATLDSVDQGASFPASSITLNDSTLKIAMDIRPVPAAYEGKVNSDASSISGTWTQGRSLPLDFHRGVIKTPKAAKPSDIDGAWAGLLDFGAQKLHIVFHMVNTEDGLIATADSPDQGAKGMPVTVTRDGASLKLELKGAGAVFDGKIAVDLKSISGTFTQGPNNIPLVLAPVKQ